MVLDRHNKTIAVGDRYLITGEVSAIDATNEYVALCVGRNTMHVPAQHLTRFDRALHQHDTKKVFGEEVFEYLNTDRWSTLTTGSGAAVDIVDTDITSGMSDSGAYAGVVQLDSGTSGTGGAALAHANRGLLDLTDYSGWFFELHIRPNMGANGNIVRFGFCDQSIEAANDTPGKGLWLECERVSGTQYWRVITKTAGAGTSNDDATTLTANNFSLRKMGLQIRSLDVIAHEDGDSDTISIDTDYSAGSDGMWRPFVQVLTNSGTAASKAEISLLRWGKEEGSAF